VNVRIRSAVLGDVAALGRVMVMSWVSAHQGQMPDEAWRRRVDEWTPEVSAQGWARVLGDQSNGEDRRDVLLIADDEAGQLLGLVYGRAAKDDDTGSIAEIRALYVSLDRQGQGIGAALLGAATEELTKLGFATIRLEVLSANLPARGFYEQMGGREVGQGTFDEDGYLLPVTIYEWASHIRGS